MNSKLWLFQKKLVIPLFSQNPFSGVLLQQILKIHRIILMKKHNGKFCALLTPVYLVSTNTGNQQWGPYNCFFKEGRFDLVDRWVSSLAKLLEAQLYTDWMWISGKLMFVFCTDLNCAKDWGRISQPALASTSAHPSTKPLRNPNNQF